MMSTMHESMQQRKPVLSDLQCGLCGKTYERRDLRDRHKRRCMLSYAKPKRSKRRSCLACVQSKLGCDQGQPSCGRCSARNIVCDYVGGPRDDSPSGPEDTYTRPGSGHGTMEESRNGSSTASASYGDKENGSTGGFMANVEEDGNMIDMENFLSEERSHITTPNGSFPPGSNGMIFGGISSSVDQNLGMHSYSMAMDDVVPSAGVHHIHTQTPGLISAQHLATTWSPGIENGGNDSFPFLNDMMLAPSGRHSRTNSTSGRVRALPESFSVSPNEDGAWSGNPSNNDRAAFAALWNNVQPAHGHANGAPVTTHHHHSPEPLENGSQKQKLQVFNLISAEKIVDVLLSFLPMMVSQTEAPPPFIHNQTYRCFDGDVKEPIARAMVCINAHSGAMPSGRKFVFNMINRERDELIRSFHTCSSDVDTLAALHGIIVYQILGLFSGSEEQTRVGELHNQFLLKMVRKVIRRYRQELLEGFATSTTSAWKHWSFLETLRRTIFVVHVINVTSARLKKQDPFFYEALDDDFILGMPLPVPPPLWEARSESQWLAARTGVSHTNVTGSMVQQGRISLPEDMDTFTKMVITTLDGLPEQSQSF